MSVLSDAAAAALAAKEAADAAERETARTQLIADAQARYNVTMLTHDGKLPVDGKDLQVPHVDLDNRLVVLSDGTTAVAVRGEEILHVVEDDGQWVEMSRPLRNLADLGRHLDRVS